MKRVLLILLGAALPALRALAPLAAADDPNGTCLDCHSDATLTRPLPGGGTQSLAVDPAVFAKSMHGSLACVDCHADLKKVTDFPHAEKLKPVNCAACHDKPAAEVGAGAHKGQLTCAGCHGTHDIREAKDVASPVSSGKINRTCAECHDRLHAPLAGRTASYANYDVGLHGRHPVASGPGGPSCIACHGGHTVVSETKSSAALERACLKCHPKVEAEFKASVHGTINEGRANSHCFQCHGEHRSRAPSDSSLTVQNESPAEKTCGTCHPDSVARYNRSLHAYALAAGSPRAPRCESCHGAHNIRKVSDPLSPVSRGKQVETCAKCHSKIGISLDPDVRLPRSFESYAQSTHGKLLAQGNENVPICVDCHGGHAIRPRSDATSTIAHINIDKTCGQCHSGEADAYRTSIHYRALTFGIEDSPTCTGCHGEHSMTTPKDPNSRVSHFRLAHETCGRCHDNPTIIQKYGLNPNVVSTYTDSYHGLATERRSAKAPTCADCHEAHAVRTVRDPKSSVNKDNVVATCQKCHPKASTIFAASYTHAALQPTVGGLNYWITRIYWILIALVIGGMVLHNLIILNFHMLESRRHQEAGPGVVRFNRQELVQHMALSVSFILLAVTGFALKFPDSWWAQGLSAIGLNEVVRRVLHRAMAVLLIVCGVYHVVYLIVSRRGREEFMALLPAKEDIGDLTTTLRYHLNMGGKAPEYGRYDYSQKAEYWALIWGTVLMIVTGFILWFPAQLASYMPGWAITAAQTIHLYEAVLATLAIIVWHFFFVIFHPEEYPMSWTWLTGKMGLDHVRHRHGRWYRKLVQDGEVPPEKEGGDGHE
ncbi:MAG TPA: cytochrome b/b6 domain-containing protein [Thermoanaerobaculia bacterium]|nr:cytochrome b/b6 domain-containing protein [Thermoanaerobaculia bacterium]